MRSTENTMNTIHHIAIICSDKTAALEFYCEKLGFPVIRENYRPEHGVTSSSGSTCFPSSSQASYPFASLRLEESSVISLFVLFQRRPTSLGSSLSFGYEGKLAPCADVPSSKKTHCVGLFFEFWTQRREDDALPRPGRPAD